MTHPSEDDLVLHFYGEHRRPAAVEAHLDVCPSCRDAFGDLAQTLALVGEALDAAPPARDELYGLEVWQRVRPALPAREPAWWSLWCSLRPSHLLTAAVVLAAAAFLLGRQRAPVGAPEASIPAADVAGRIRLAAIADHLERSERVLLDVVNADPEAIDLPAQQARASERASDLIAANRLYRDAAARAGEGAIAQVLDDLERSLLELANGPTERAPAGTGYARLRRRAAGLLFDVRVLADELAHEVRADGGTRRVRSGAGT